MANSCPTCHRSATWSNRWQSCTACDQAELFSVTKLDPRDVHSVTVNREVVEARVREADGSVTVHRKPGRPSLHGSPMTPAERAKAYRQRKASTS